jgi:hypothetical protein
VGHEGGATVSSTVDRPAFYAIGTGSAGLRAWVTVLHPPYTAWHLSYVAIGAALAPRFALWRLGGTLAAFFLAVGVTAHALDELRGRPLRTSIQSSVLVGAAALSLGTTIVAGWVYGGLRLLPFVVVGVVLVLGYNLELPGLHNAATFGLAWGAFPVLTGFYAQDFSLGFAAFAAAAGACLFSLGQRALSTRARALRRRTASVHGRVELHDGSIITLDRATLLAPLEATLRCTAAGLVLVATALVVARL